MNGYRFELTKMAVAKEWQGYKIAQKLMEVCIKNAMDEGAKTLYLETNSKLIPANRLYRKIGFKDLKVGEKSIYARCNVFLELDLTKGYSFIRLQRGEA
jgi:ribosomal protein S18 acetylase RimI-like enzyme